MLVALIGLGVGIGCSLAGQMSGNRLELGLVPVGGFSLVLLTLGPRRLCRSGTATIVCLIGIGVAAGLYIVPMYTLLQHRAPKESKGSMVATSNFLNVTGGLVAVVVFYFVTYGLQTFFGLTLTSADAGQNEAALTRYIAQLAMAERIPPMLFISASLITALVLVLSVLAAAGLLAAGVVVAADPGAAAAEGGHMPIICRRHGPSVVGHQLRAVGAMDARGGRARSLLAVCAAEHSTGGDDALLANTSRRLGVSLEGLAGRATQQAEQLVSRSGTQCAARGEPRRSVHWRWQAAARSRCELFRKLQIAASVSHSAGVLRRVS